MQIGMFYYIIHALIHPLIDKSVKK